MTPDRLFADDELAIEPDEIEPEPELAIEPDDRVIEPSDALIERAIHNGFTTASEVRAQQSVVDVALVPSASPLMEVLDANFPLPALIKFCPDERLKAAADQATAYALSIEVTGPEGLQRADVALSALRASQKAIEEHFAEPASIANELHKRLTTRRSEWLAAGKAAIEKKGREVYNEQRRIDAAAAEQRRQDQERADKDAREAARREADAAAKNQAPTQVVQEMQRRAETATAPPVTQAQRPVLIGNSTVERWKARPSGTPADAEPNPDIAAMSPTQIQCVDALLSAILVRGAPLAAIAIDWSYLNKRAAAEKGTFAIPGFEAFDAGGVRAKGGRR